MWQWYALTAMICFAAMQLIFTYLGRRGLDPAAMLLVVFGFGALLYLGHVRIMHTPLAGSRSVVALLITAAVLSYVGNLSALRALAGAPNPGYSVAVVGIQAAVVTVMAIVFLGASFSWIKGIGVVLCALGVALLVI